MPWGMIIAAGISAAGSAVSANNSGAGAASKGFDESQQALRQLSQQLRAGGFQGSPTGDIFGSRPEHIPFQPVDVGAEQQRSIGFNQNALESIAQLQRGANTQNLQESALRFESLAPGGLGALNSLGGSAASLSAGQLPFDDVLGIVRDRGQLSASLGLAGTQLGGALPRDLGLSRLDALSKGASLTGSLAQITNQIAPLSQQLSAQNFFVDPRSSIDTALRQNILQQQSDQSGALIASAPDPTAKGPFDLDIQRLFARAGAAPGVGAAGAAGGANFGQIAQGLGGVAGSLFGGTNQGGGSSSRSGAGINTSFNGTTPGITINT